MAAATCAIVRHVHDYMVGVVGPSAFHKLCAPKENPCEHKLYTAAELEFHLRSSARSVLTNSCRLTVSASTTLSTRIT